MPSKHLSFEGNLQENWKTWRRNFGYYLTATEYSDKSDAIKSSLFLHCIGEEGREVYNTLDFDTADDNMKYDKILEKFEAYANPRKNTTFCRYKFFTYRQSDGQPFDKYLTEMKKLCNDCELGNLKDSLLTDMLIIGLNNKQIQERLMKEDTITLDKVIKNCQTAELTKQQARFIQKASSSVSVDVDYVRRQKGSNFHSSQSSYNGNSQSSHKVSQSQGKITNCNYCSYSHDRGACPAYSKTCNTCRKRGHFSKCCKAKKVSHKVSQISNAVKQV